MAVIDVSSVEDATTALASARGPVVVIPIYNAHDDVLQAIESVLRNTPISAAILLVDDAGGDKRAFDKAAASPAIGDRLFVILRHVTNTGFVGSCNDAFVAAGRNDVILVNSDVVVGPEWYERLVDAAASSSLVATVSTLTNHGTILSVPTIDKPQPQLPPNHTPETAAVAVAQMSAKIRPSIPTAIGHCVLVRRAALNVLGGFDTAFGRGYGEEVDFSQRAIRAGFKNICADDVFVFHRGSGSFGSEVNTAQQENDRTVVGRYPWYAASVVDTMDDPSHPLHVALTRASIALRGMTVAVDGRALGPLLMGTQQVIIETVRTLLKHPVVASVRLYVSNEVPVYARERLSDVQVEYVRVLRNEDIPSDKCDVAYRPYQASNPDDLRFLRAIGKWISINQLDNIAFSNPAYFPNNSDWVDYRNLGRMSLSLVDGIAYLSKSSQREAHAEGLVATGVSEKVVYTGSQFEKITQSVMPVGLKGIEGPFIFVLGVSYLHKNRILAVHMHEILRSNGWRGKLVLAGPTPPSGSSLGLEAERFLADPSLRDSIVQLPSLTEFEKRWMFENSRLMLYPTVVEGFGLIPFEAAMYGLPTLATRQGSLEEVLPTDIPTIEEMSAESMAEIADRLLSDDELRLSVVSSLVQRGSEFSAQKTTDLLVELFLEMTKSVPNRLVAINGENDRLVSLDPELAMYVKINKKGVVALGGIVKLGWKVPIIKRIVSPNGSRRQKFIRRAANSLRRRLHR